MGKYIVELKKNETLYKAATRESDGAAYVCSAIGTPYTEPDMEKIREEAYDKGYDTAKHECEDCTKPVDNGKAYQMGLNDAWEVARKVIALSTVDRREVFGSEYMYSILEKNTATEAIEKIRQYEQEKEQQIQVGDEIKSVSGKAVVTGLSPDNEHVRYVYFDGSTGVIHKSSVSRTGRHFPEIAEVLRKMKEEST